MRIRAADTASTAAALALAALAVLTAVAVAASACGGPTESTSAGFFRQYEYEEDVYLSLDGTATVYVNTSLAALNALRGTSFATAPNAPLDREAIRAFFSTPVTRVSQISASRRSNRRFIHVKLDVDNIGRLGEAVPFAWSNYRFKRDGDLYVYRQTIGSAAGKDVGSVGWSGKEMVAFRMHLPSIIRYQNNDGRGVDRGNIVRWEQSLSDRLRGTPLVLDARMDPQSILYSTLSLFGWTLAAVAISFVLMVWWIRQRAPVEKEIA